MRYQRLQYDVRDGVLLIRLLPITERVGESLRCLRDELLELVVRFRPRQLIADFDDLHGWPAEVMGCFTHAKRAMPTAGSIRCVGVALRLRAVCRFLKLDRGLVEFFDTVEAAISSSESFWNQTILDAIHPVPRHYSGAA